MRPVIIALHCDASKMTAREFEKARDDIRHYAEITLQVQGGRLLGTRPVAKLQPAEKKRRP